MLDAFALVVPQVFFDLALLIRALVDRNADLAVRAGQRLGEQAGQLALDVEVADLAEVEDALVEIRPGIHVAAVDVVGQVIDVVQAGAVGSCLPLAGPDEIDVVDRAAVTVAVDEVEQAAADALDRRNVEFHRTDAGFHRLGPEAHRTLEGVPGIGDAERHGAGAGAVLLGEAAGEAVRLGVDDEVDVALPVKRHIPGAMLGDRREAHGPEEFMKLLRFRRGVLDELEAVGAGGVLVRDLGPRCVVRVGTHRE